MIQAVTAFLILIAGTLQSAIPYPTYSEGIVGQPVSFVPLTITNDIDKTVSKLIYRGLFKYDIYGQIQPDLADNWKISDGGTVYTIKLKDGQKWSDGTPITADDLIYTSYVVPNLQGVATDKVDDLTVRYTLPNQFSPFLSMLTVGVMKRGTSSTENSLYPVSSGPFKVVRIEREGDFIKKVILINNSSQNIKRVVFKFYQTSEDIEVAAKMGESNSFITSATEPSQLPEGFELYRYPVQSVYYALYFNLRNEKFQDKDLREKFVKTLPVSRLVSNLGIPVEGAVSKSVYTSEIYKQERFDKNAEFDLKDLHFTITYPKSQANEELMRAVSDIWEAKLNVKITLQGVEPGEMEEKVIKPRNFEVLFYGQEIGRDPDRYINWHSTQTADPGLNLSGMEQVRADHAVEEGRKALNYEDRFIHYNEFQKVIFEQNPAVFLYHPYINYAVSKRINGVGDKYTFTVADRFLDFPNWRFL